MAFIRENRAKPQCPWAVFAATLVLISFGLFLLFYVINDEAVTESTYVALKLTTRHSLEEMKKFAYENTFTESYKPSLYVRRNLSFNRILQDSEYRFDIDANDVIVFLHIQKTAGTSFERFLVRHLNITRPCICNMGKKRCNCFRPSSRDTWLFSRYSTGWVCGLHADFTELVVSGCVDHALDEREGKHQKRRYYYTTFLRNPIERFISEYRHVARGATWLASRHICNGKPPTPEELPLCFNPQIGWDDVELDEFLSCPFNMAFNRQTRMLADLTLVHCYDTASMNATMRDRLLLESAKANLKNLAFFGIKERMNESQTLFENVFNMKFTEQLSNWNKSKSQDTPISPQQLELIKERNRLDIELYAFAERLFLRRLKLIQQKDSSIETTDATTIGPVDFAVNNNSTMPALLNLTTPTPLEFSAGFPKNIFTNLTIS